MWVDAAIIFSLLLVIFGSSIYAGLTIHEIMEERDAARREASV